MTKRMIIIPTDAEDSVVFDPFRFMELTDKKIKLDTSNELCNFAFNLPTLPPAYQWEIVVDRGGNNKLVALRMDNKTLKDVWPGMFDND